MIPADCKPYLERIRRQCGYLFDEYGFEAVYGHIYSGPRPPYGKIVLESKDCRVRFEWEEGLPGVEFGTHRADYEGSSYGAGKQWFSLSNIARFLRRETVNLAEQDAVLAPLDTFDARLEYWCDQLRPICGRVVEMFREQNFEAWQEDFRQYERWVGDEIMRQVKKG